MEVLTAVDAHKWRRGGSKWRVGGSLDRWSHLLFIEEQAPDLN
jgi:hypothetical protein